jgi:hypothetical protein
MGNCCGAKAAFENATRLAGAETLAPTPGGLATRSFDFLARKNFQITEPIGTSANRLVARATAGAIPHIQIDANRF